MNTVTGQIDFLGEKVSVKLVADKDVTPFSWPVPITWTGFIAGQSVKIIQNDWDGGPFADGFYFELIPEKYAGIEHHIIRLIDDAMRELD